MLSETICHTFTGYHCSGGAGEPTSSKSTGSPCFRRCAMVPLIFAARLAFADLDGVWSAKRLLSPVDNLCDDEWPGRCRSVSTKLLFTRPYTSDTHRSFPNRKHVYAANSRRHKAATIMLTMTCCYQSLCLQDLFNRHVTSQSTQFSYRHRNAQCAFKFRRVALMMK